MGSNEKNMDMSEDGYLKLVSPTFEKTIDTLEVILGRQHEAQENVKTTFVGFDNDKNISRQHARLFWDQDEREWKIQCLGKNGLTLNQKEYKKDEMAKLSFPCRLKIGTSACCYIVNAI